MNIHLIIGSLKSCNSFSPEWMKPYILAILITHGGVDVVHSCEFRNEMRNV